MITRRDLLKRGVVTTAAALSWPAMSAAETGAAWLGGVTPASGRDSVITTCNMCTLGCSVVATRAGERIVHLRGNPDSPVNRGRLCAKGHAGLYKAVHPERLGYPLIRAGARGEGRWRRVSWEQALRTVATALQGIRADFGPQSIALWQNLNMDRPDVFKRFVYALGSPNFIGHISTCDASRLIGGAMTYGVARASYDYANAECIVAAGINPLGAKDLVLAAREIMEAKAKGAVLITVDPRLSETAARSDLWLPIRPGSDGVLLAGWANWLIEHDRFDHDFVRRHTFGFEMIRRYLKQFTVDQVCETTGIDRQRFLRAVRHTADHRSVVACGRGVITHADATDAARMAEILNALLGAFDREGGVQLFPFPPIALNAVLPEVKDPGGRRIDGANADRIPLPIGRNPEFPAAFFGVSHEVPRRIRTELPYPLKAVIFNAVNPVYSLPQGEELVAAFERLKLIVSLDAFMSETTGYADVVLPASTYLEGLDLWFPPTVKLSLRQPVIRPQMESLPSQEIIIALAHTMGMTAEFPFRSYEDFLLAQLQGSGIDYRELREKGFIACSDEELRPGRRRQDGFSTPSGKIELVSGVLTAAGFAPEPVLAQWKKSDADQAFPYHLVTYKLPFHTQSATAENPYLAGIQRDNPVLINPDTAAALGVTTGGRVVIESARGAITARVRVSPGIRPDTLALSHHFGHRAYSRAAAGRGVNGNVVIADGTDPIGGNLAFNDTRVRVRPA
ncbi:MAG: molybdopterin-dependent oxidoreductase [Deltaproteobacteria bacterium]|nr:molybdopterin-dependent oxidoreductase [Deltaproteobacteria bacterium]